MADSMYGVVWVSGLLMSTLWIKLPMVAVGLRYAQAYVMDNEKKVHFIDGILNGQRYRNDILRPENKLYLVFNHYGDIRASGKFQKIWP
ncbi:hypothetical protein M9458_023923, partial [Cirrhinus mrigala]